MVRPKLQLERLNGELSRDHYFLHNRAIVSQKVREMSVLTATDVLFLAFSPDGIPSLHLGEYSNLMNVVMRLARIPYNDREKRRLDNLQTLRANYQKDEYNVEVDTLFQAWKVKRLQEMQQELSNLNKELDHLNNEKSFWENPEKIDNIEMIMEMEKRLEKSLEGVRQRKAELAANQIISTPDHQIPVEPFEDYIPEMLSGNDDLLAYANILMS